MVSVAPFHFTSLKLFNKRLEIGTRLVQKYGNLLDPLASTIDISWVICQASSCRNKSRAVGLLRHMLEGLGNSCFKINHIKA